MSTPCDPDITITPTTSPVEEFRKVSATRSLPLAQHIVKAFRGVPKELQPQWDPSDHIYTKAEVAKVLPLPNLPRALVPRPGMEIPPCLLYGLPISREQIFSLAKLRDPNVQLFAKSGLISIEAKRLVTDSLTKEIGWQVYLDRALNTPDTPYVICILDNLSIEACVECNEMPKGEHIRRMRKALGAHPKARLMWYIAAGYYTWRCE